MSDTEPGPALRAYREYAGRSGFAYSDLALHVRYRLAVAAIAELQAALGAEHEKTDGLVNSLYWRTEQLNAEHERVDKLSQQKDGLAAAAKRGMAAAADLAAEHEARVKAEGLLDRFLNDEPPTLAEIQDYLA